VHPENLRQRRDPEKLVRITFSVSLAPCEVRSLLMARQAPPGVSLTLPITNH
jgi:hypothetical protein